jgi:predicted phosphoribosyltransferase
VARHLHLPLDVVTVRKLGFPGREELAFGAVASGGFLAVNNEVAALVDAQEQEAIIARERQELLRREQIFRRGRPPMEVRGKVCLIVDDGLATGASMKVAVAAVRDQEPARAVVAVPVGPVETCAELKPLVDELVCCKTPEPFYGVGWWYEDFSPVPDSEVVRLLALSSSSAVSTFPAQG